MWSTDAASSQWQGCSGSCRFGPLRLRWKVATVGSARRSLEERRPLGSGRLEESRDEPISPGGSAIRFLARGLLPGVPVALGAWADCNPARRVRPTLGEVALVPDLPPLGLAVGWHALMLWSARRKVTMARAAVTPVPP